MADHRKTFRPRRLGLDGRLLPRGRLFGAALVLLGALLPAQAQDLGLKNGQASLAAGKYDAAVRQLSATVNDEKSTPGQAAQALYLRGVAYRKLGQPGRAVADLGAAVWLGLPTSDRVRALVNKGLAYRAASLSSQAEAAISEARKISSSSEVERLIAEDGGPAVASADPGSFETAAGAGETSSGDSMWSRLVPSFGASSSSAPPPAPAPGPSEPTPARTAEAPPSSGWGATVSDGPAEESGSRVGRWLGSLTGDNAPAPAAEPAVAPVTPAPAPAPRTTSTPKTAAAPPPAASWAANTQTSTAAAEGEGGTAIGRWFSRATDSGPAPAATEALRAPSGGGYTVQLANSRSQAEAEALWKQAQRSNQQLASAGSRIEKVNIGSFGTFYSVKIGPFADQAESTKVCNALKRSGTDCSVISPEGP